MSTKGAIVLNNSTDKKDAALIKQLRAKQLDEDNNTIYYAKDPEGGDMDYHQTKTAAHTIGQMKAKANTQKTLGQKLLTKKVKAFIDNGDPTPAALEEATALVAKIYPRERNPQLLFLTMAKDYAKSSLAAMGDAPPPSGGAGSDK